MSDRAAWNEPENKGKSPYALVHTEKSRCPRCHKSVMLLSTDKTRGVQFYICFPCWRVFHVGIGEVLRLS